NQGLGRGAQSRKTLVVNPLEPVERRLRRAVRARQSEGPTFDLGVENAPLVGPTVDHRAAESFFKSRAYLPLQEIRLGGFAIPIRIEPQLREQQRLLSRHVLEARQVSPELRFTLQVN